MTRRGSRVALLVAAAFLLCLALTPHAGAFVYWANAGDGTIGRANLDGTAANQSLIGGGESSCGVAVDGAHLYWANDTTTGTIGRANLDGAGVNQNFIGGATFPCGVAVDALPLAPSPPSNQFSLGRTKLNRNRGTALLPVSIPGPGELALAGKGLIAASGVHVNAVRAQTAVQLLIATRGAQRRQLRRTGKVTIRPTITYTPDGGTAGGRSTKLKLKKVAHATR
jgi:hypothetical protein